MTIPTDPLSETLWQQIGELSEANVIPKIAPEVLKGIKVKDGENLSEHEFLGEEILLFFQTLGNKKAEKLITDLKYISDYYMPDEDIAKIAEKVRTTLKENNPVLELQENIGILSEAKKIPEIKTEELSKLSLDYDNHQTKPDQKQRTAISLFFQTLGNKKAEKLITELKNISDNYMPDEDFAKIAEKVRTTLKENNPVLELQENIGNLSVAKKISLILPEELSKLSLNYDKHRTNPGQKQCDAIVSFFQKLGNNKAENLITELKKILKDNTQDFHNKPKATKVLDILREKKVCVPPNVEALLLEDKKGGRGRKRTKKNLYRKASRRKSRKAPRRKHKVSRRRKK